MVNILNTCEYLLLKGYKSRAKLTGEFIETYYVVLFFGMILILFDNYWMSYYVDIESFLLLSLKLEKC